MLRPAGEHPVRFGRRLRDQIVAQHADVRLLTTEDDVGTAVAGEVRRVDAGDEALSRGLFVAAGAVDLPGKKQSADLLGLQRRRDLRRPDHVVLDGVPPPDDLSMLQARDVVEHGPLRVGRQCTC